MNNTSLLSLDQKLQSEQRVCPQCALDVANPFLERCPRCYARLPYLNLNCTGCVHSTICPALRTKPLAPKQGGA